MHIKATIVAYAFSVQYFENATIVAYAGLRVNSSDRYEKGNKILCSSQHTLKYALFVQNHMKCTSNTKVTLH